jgi:uncharacterized phage-associated protein
LYRRVRAFGADPIRNVFREVADLPDADARAQSLDAVLDTLGEASAARLVAITHWKHGAWARHYRPGGRGIVIPDGDILDEYRERNRAAAGR